MKTYILAEKSHEHADLQRTRSTDPEELEADRVATAVLSGQKASVGAGDLNAEAMRRAGIREDVIQQLKAALKYAAELKPPGGTP